MARWVYKSPPLDTEVRLPYFDVVSMLMVVGFRAFRRSNKLLSDSDGSDMLSVPVALKATRAQPTTGFRSENRILMYCTVVVADLSNLIRYD